MQNQEIPQGHIDSVYHGFLMGLWLCIAGQALLTLVLVVLVFFEVVTHDPGLFLLGPSINLFLFLFPLSQRLRKNRQLETRKGFFLFAGLIFLASSPCFAGALVLLTE